MTIDCLFRFSNIAMLFGCVILSSCKKTQSLAQVSAKEEEFFEFLLTLDEESKQRVAAELGISNVEKKNGRFVIGHDLPSAKIKGPQLSLWSARSIGEVNVYMYADTMTNQKTNTVLVVTFSRGGKGVTFARFQTGAIVNNMALKGKDAFIELIFELDTKNGGRCLVKGKLEDGIISGPPQFKLVEDSTSAVTLPK